MPRIRLWQFTSVLLIALSAGLGLAVARGGWLAAQDAAISENLRDLNTGWLHTVMSAVSAVFSPLGGVAILALLALGLGLRRRWADLLATVATIGGGWLSALLLKTLIDRPRPPLAVEHSASYPSGHVALVTAVVFAVFFLVRGVDVRDGVLVGGALLIVLVAFSRMILGAHYLTDTVGAVLVVSGVVVGLSGLWQIAITRLGRRAPAPALLADPACARARAAAQGAGSSVDPGEQRGS